MLTIQKTLANIHLSNIRDYPNYPNTYEDRDTTIKDILENKIKKEHLINYLKHRCKIYKL